MKLLTGTVVVVCTFLALSCGHVHSIADHSNDTSKQLKKPPQTTVKEDAVSARDTTTNLSLNHGFKIIAGGKRAHTGYGNFFELWHNGKKLFVDTTQEYLVDDRSHTILNKLRPSLFELLLEFDDRPNKNELILLRIDDDKIVKQDTLPTFDGKPERIGGMVIRSGVWDNDEEWDENGIRYKSFDPVIYYKFTPDGIKLDSALTRERTKETYGNVDPFEHDEEIGFPIDEKNNIDTVAKHVLRKKIEPLPKRYSP